MDSATMVARCRVSLVPGHRKQDFRVKNTCSSLSRRWLTRATTQRNFCLWDNAVLSAEVRMCAFTVESHKKPFSPLASFTQKPAIITSHTQETWSWSVCMFPFLQLPRTPVYTDNLAGPWEGAAPLVPCQGII